MIVTPAEFDMIEAAVSELDKIKGAAGFGKLERDSEYDKMESAAECDTIESPA